MLARGILTSDNRVELLAGEIVEKTTIGSRHGACVDKLNRFISLALGDRAIVRVQGPVALPPDSCPEPDLAILRSREDFYAGAHPRPDQVLLVIEVSESSLDFDYATTPLFRRGETLAAGALADVCSSVDAAI